MSKPPDPAIVDPSHRSSSSAAKGEPGSQAGDLMGLTHTIELDRPLRFSAPNGGTVELDPGTYRVHAGADGDLVLTSADRESTHSIAASSTWHDLGLASPMALSVPGEDERHVVMILPGGGALQATGWSGAPGEGNSAFGSVTAQDLVQAVLKWQQPVSVATALPFDKSILFKPWLWIWGSFSPAPRPPAWARAAFHPIG